MARSRKPIASGKPRKNPQRQGGNLPSREELLAFIAESEGKVGKREIGRAFGVRGDDRIPLKQMLKQLADEGLIAKREDAGLAPVGKLKPISIIEITHRDMDGDLIARPVDWPEDSAPPQIVIAPDPQKPGRRERDAEPPAGVGDRVLAKMTPNTDDSHIYAYEARVIRLVGKGAERILGLFRASALGGRLVPVDKRVRNEFEIGAHDVNDASDGDLVLAETIPGKGHGRPRARIREIFGRSDDPRSISLIAIHAHGIPDAFPDETLREAESIVAVGPEGRVDLRDIPLVTIDPVDARDHDDAVWAAPDDDPRNEGGVVVIVAIADVATYVRRGSPMDREARKRGNSTYFPDRVVPMLPERISNDLCSLRELEDRPCLAVRMVFDAHGNKRSHKFMRALMRSAAKLSYKQMQQAIDGRPDEKTGPLVATVLQPLWEAYQIVARARDARGPLALDLPEYKIDLDKDGNLKGVHIAEKFESMRLIEEFMIQANVCAAETSEEKRRPVIYRVHDAPSPEKLVALSDFLATLNMSFGKDKIVKPSSFNRVLHEVQDTEYSQMVSDVVLRSQSQAIYAADNIGHFGLNLRRYAHFTSPIRRYADLVVHRALIAGLGFGADGQSDAEVAELGDIAEHISLTERRSMIAERESTDRFIARHLEASIGASFQGRIAGVTRFGLFVKLLETGADGLVPIANLGSEYFHHDEAGHALVGERSGLTYRLGDPVTVRLEEAVPVTGGLRFEMLEGGSKGTPHKGPRPRSTGGRPGTGGKRAPLKPKTSRSPKADKTQKTDARTDTSAAEKPKTAKAKKPARKSNAKRQNQI